jgi:Na+-transporting NADH:ubiquinone oxidoreductase subunit NqrC
MMMNKYQSSTLQMILLQIIVAAMIIGTILAFSVVVITTQQEANAASTTFSFEQNQNNTCSGFVHCSNIGTITLKSGSGGNGPDN